MSWELQFYLFFNVFVFCSVLNNFVNGFRYIWRMSALEYMEIFCETLREQMQMKDSCTKIMQKSDQIILK